MAARFSVDGKVAIVTGGGSGICFAFTKLLLSKNCSVVIGDLSLRSEAQALLETYKDKPKALFHKTDVTDWTSLTSLFKYTTTHFPTFDIVCPGAGVFEPPFSNFWHPPSSSLSKDPTEGLGHYATLDINITHPIRATQLALSEFMYPTNPDQEPADLESNPKRIIHVASVAAQGANICVPLYIASKHAIDGFVRSFEDLEPKLGIRVAAVGPGMVRTPLWTEHPEKLTMIDEGQDMWIEPEEVAEAMLRLCEDTDLKGGTVLEVGHKSTRIVPMFGNQRSTGAGFTLANLSKNILEVYQLLATKGWGRMS